MNENRLTEKILESDGKIGRRPRGDSVTGGGGCWKPKGRDIVENGHGEGPKTGYKTQTHKRVQLKTKKA